MTQPELKYRSSERELMDLPGVDVQEIHKALHELKLINKWLGGNKVITSGLKELTLGVNDFSIVDIGCGGGDVLALIHKWGFNNRKNIKLAGIDINASIIAYASKNLNNIPGVKLFCSDVNKLPAGLKFDYSTCTLFCHHFDDQEVVELIKVMYHISNRGVLINDIHRHWLAYHSIKYLTMLFSKTYLVKNDAPLSVARSFTLEDWKRILDKAGISNYKISWKWAFRWQIVIRK